jgi:uncharacterized protein (DUF2062 family)
MQRFKNYFTKVKQKLNNLLRQGMKPPQLALALALGAAIGTFPVIGTNTAILILLCLVLRLNYVAPQITNYGVYPLQILMLVPFFQIGNALFQFKLTIHLESMLQLFKENWWMAMQKFGLVIWAAVIGWAVLVIPFFIGVYFIFLFFLQKMARSQKIKEAK